ncbi:MAG: hypothetical protein P8Y97_23070 [Candidatus Lokiarchaeota archaeon]
MAFPDPNSGMMAEKAGGWSQVIYLWLLFSGIDWRYYSLGVVYREAICPDYYLPSIYLI